MLNKFTQLLSLFIQIVRLPVVNLRFKSEFNQEDVVSTYKDFTKPHPKYKIIKNKTLGVALVDLHKFSSSKEYVEQFKSKDKGAFHAKKARSKGYTLCEIDQNDYIDDIHDINTSLDTRQGQKMEEIYLQKKSHYEPINNHRYYGVLNKNGKLMAYCDFGFYGDFAALSHCIGYRNNDGCMHFMLVGIICHLIDEGITKYFIYDTWFGAQPGLKKFKASIGFEPHRATYTLQ